MVKGPLIVGDSLHVFGRFKSLHCVYRVFEVDVKPEMLAAHPSTLRRVQGMSLGVVLVVMCSLLVRFWDVPLLQGIQSFLAPLNPLTAVMFLLFNASVLSLMQGWVWASRATAALMALTGSLVLLNLVVDLPLVVEALKTLMGWLVPSGLNPPIMAPNTSLNALLLGMALLCYPLGSRNHLPTQLMAALAFMLSMVPFLGHLYGLRDFYHLPGHQPMSLPTSFLFFLCSIMVLCLQGKYGLVGLIRQRTLGGALARFLIPSTLVVTGVLAGWVISKARQGWFDGEHGIAYLAVLIMLVFAVPTYFLSLVIHRSDRQRLASEQALQQRELRHRAVLENAADGIITTDQNGIILSVNPSAQRMFGFEDQAWLGLPVAALLKQDMGDAPEAFQKRLNHLISTEVQGQTLTLMGQRMDSSLFDLELTLSVWEAAGERFFTGLFRDITLRKQAELDRANLAAIVETSQDAIISTNLQGEVQFINRAAEVLYGYGAAELVGQPIHLLFPEEIRHQEAAILQNMGEGQTIQNLETVRRCKDGRILQVSISISPLFSQAGEVIGVSSIARDVTEQRKARTERDRLAAIVETSQDAMVSTALSGTILTWNRGAERLYGKLAYQMIGRHVQEVLPPVWASEEMSFLQALERGESISELETLRPRADGQMFCAQVAVSALRALDGTLLGAATVVRDIDGLKQIQHELQTTLDYARTLLDVSRASTEQRPALEIAHELVWKIGQAAGLDWAGLAEQEGDEMVLKPVWMGEKAKQVPMLMVPRGVPRGAGLVWAAIEEGRSLYHDDHAGQPGANPQMVQAGLTSVAFIPLTPFGKEPALVVVGVKMQEGSKWNEQERNLFDSATATVQVALERQERLQHLETAALKDPLTGLGNRRSFEEDLRAEFARAKRHQSHFGVMLLDMDGLKTINDSLGHHEGDRLLSSFAEQLQQSMRQEDRCYRLGGDEFAVVLIGSTSRNRERLFQRVQQVTEKVQGMGFPTAGASVGLACFPEDAQDPEALVALADVRMYQMKADHRKAKS